MKTRIISSPSERLISIHKIDCLARNYLFEFAETTNFFIYAHFVNINAKFILIRNEKDKSLKILRNFKLKTLSKSVYINAFKINSCMSNLALRTSKQEHKTA